MKDELVMFDRLEFSDAKKPVPLLRKSQLFIVLYAARAVLIP